MVIKNCIGCGNNLAFFTNPERLFCDDCSKVPLCENCGRQLKNGICNNCTTVYMPNSFTFPKLNDD
jgi:predicted RNA-binding Zn-ribbon protein involved in translation (DUF1610 family)